MVTHTSTRSWMIWFTGAVVYLLAVFHRASFGVAGLYAVDRFEVGAAALSTFTVLQVAVYAVMQIPTGMLVDRFGPRRVLTVALLFLGLGQVLLAVATSYPVGLLARGVLGFGDALTFVSVLRLTAAHFSGRWYPLVASLTTAMGYVGNLIATVPLSMMLASQGWMPTYLVVGLATVVFAVVTVFVIRDTPRGDEFASGGESEAGGVTAQVREAWRVPATRLGFWVHFTTMFAPNVLTLLWGVPFLVKQEGFSQTAASSLLMVFVFGAMFGGPLVGALVGRRPSLRMPFVGSYIAAAVVVWAVLLSWSGSIPLAVLVLGFAVLSFGGPVSTIGFLLTRDYNPLQRVGTATGVVNVGGFVATTVTALLVGVLVQMTGGEYRIALLAVVAALVFGGVRLLTWWRRTRAAIFAAQERGDEVPVCINRRRWDKPRAHVGTTS